MATIQFDREVLRQGLNLPAGAHRGVATDGERKWAAGEIGGVCITDGSSIKLRTGGVPGALAKLCGMAGTKVPASTVSADALQTIAIGAWLKIAGVKPLKRWQAKGGGRSQMLYTALVFEGV